MEEERIVMPELENQGEERFEKVHLSNMTDLVINPTYDTIDQASTKIKGLLNK